LDNIAIYTSGILKDHWKAERDDNVSSYLLQACATTQDEGDNTNRTKWWLTIARHDVFALLLVESILRFPNLKSYAGLLEHQEIKISSKMQ